MSRHPRASFAAEETLSRKNIFFLAHTRLLVQGV